ncbi:MAG: radical SAM protein [Verrucomicrobiae bacterium]|nr:radical SAM protein [Verrucomicrobiae bacterium]
MSFAPVGAPALLDRQLKTTTGRCLVCHRQSPAEVWVTGEVPGRVYLKRTCSEHGEQWSLLSSDEQFYWLSVGAGKAASGECCGGSCGVPKGKNEAPDTIERLSTCLALIEIVNSCNLKCPTCFADSPVGIGKAVDAVPLPEIQARIQGVIDRKGGIEVLQLSGGEPTLHPEFFELIRWINANPGIDYVLINTNGVRLANDDAFLAEMGEVVNLGHMQVYLQFDGTGEAAQRELRGGDLRSMKRRAVERCGEIGLPITLAMTVIPENLGELWETITFGLEFPHVSGISFQPMFGSGRVGRRDTARLNVADLIHAAVSQSGGKLKNADFTPLPCGDPNCATIGYLLKVGGEVRSISDFVDFAKVQGFLADRVRYSIEDLEHCGCESEPLGALLKEFELDVSHTFRMFIKPFMDAHSWDEDRIDRCCTHVIRPDGKLDSFCRYYSGFSDCQA